MVAAIQNTHVDIELRLFQVRTQCNTLCLEPPVGNIVLKINGIEKKTTKNTLIFQRDTKSFVKLA